MSDSHSAGPDTASDILIRLPDVLARVRVSRPSLYRLIARGAAPAPIRLGRMSVWRASEIDAWIAGLGRGAQ